MHPGLNTFVTTECLICLVNKNSTENVFSNIWLTQAFATQHKEPPVNFFQPIRTILVFNIFCRYHDIKKKSLLNDVIE